MAVKDLNNSIIRFGKPVPVILNHTAGLHDLCSKGDNPILRSQYFQIYDDCHMLATYRPKLIRVKFKPHLYLDLDKSLKKKTKIVCKKLKQNIKINLRLPIRIRLVNQTKGVKLGFEYDHVAPSGFGVVPIKRVPTAMFSLVRIRPMFEQEAPK